MALDGGRAAAEDDAFAFDSAGDIRPLADIEARIIKLALARYQGRIALVARKLGIGRSTLYRKLKELGLEADVTDDIAAA
jgi:DNA-binding NtrC family response regulator